MPSKTQFYAQLAAETAGRLTESLQAWTAFLETSARLYKYPYFEQLLIFAQKPEATACAGYEVWNDTMHRYVRRGSKGIALIDSSGDAPRMKYVFDVSDTGGGANARRPFLWEYRPEHQDSVTAALEQRFGQAEGVSLALQLEAIAGGLIESWWEEHRQDILGIVDGSFLEEYDEDNLRAVFKHAGTVSTAYMLMSRCGLDPSGYFTHEDFLPVFGFNTPATVGFLGTAISEASEQVLRQIEVTIKRYEREHRAERTESHERTELQDERGLSDPGSESERDGGDAAGQVREDAESLSEGAPPGAVLESAADGEAVSPSEGDRRDGAEPSGDDDTKADESGGNQRDDESREPDAVGGPDEQLQSPGGGDDSPGAGLQLSEAAYEGPGQMSLFPSEAEQIEQIAEAESVPETLPAFSIPQEDIDLLLIFGSNDNAGRMKIASEFMKQKSVEDLATFLKKTYRGAYGIETERGKFSSFAADDGIHIANGDGTEYDRRAQVLSWIDAAARIGQLLEAGQYLTNVELTEAPGFERREIAQSLLYLAHDLSKEAREAGVLSVMDQYEGGGYPDMTLRVSTALTNPEEREAILREYSAFYQAWQQDHDLLRFRFYRPAELLQRLEELNLPRRSFEANMRELPQVRHFITEDDITDALRRRVPYQNGKMGIYQYWQEPHMAKEKAVFLKDLYGTGGGNAAFSHNFLADEDYNSKGIRLRKPQCGDVLMTWAQVAKRIDKLMAQDRYLTTEEKAKLNSVREAQPTPPAYIAEYNSIKEAHPEEMVLFQRGDFFELYGEDARAASELAQLTLTTREIPGAGRVEMAGFPVHALEQYTEVLRDKYDLAVAASAEDGKHEVRRVLSIDHEAAQAIDAHEAEFGADGSRAFGPVIPEQPPTEEDITAAIQAWNDDIASKRRVFRYMQEHGRERGADQWLREEYGGGHDTFPVNLPGVEQTELPWRNVQRRIVTLLKKDRFYTDQELDNFDDVDPARIREKLAEAGIVNGELVDPDALDADPFIQQVMADAERIAQENQEEEAAPQAEASPPKRPGQTRVERNYRAFARQFPEIVSGEYRYLEMRSREDGGLMPLTIQQIGENEIAVAHTYEMNGDLMYDPEMTFRIDTENGTLEPLTFRQDGGLPIYQEVYPEPGKWIPRLRNDLSAFAEQWLKNIEMQGRVRTRAIAEIDGEDVEFTFDKQGQPVRAEDAFDTVEQDAPEDVQFSEIVPTDTPAEPFTDSLTLADGSTYGVGDTVTIGGTAFQITDIGPFDVQLLDPTLLYPVFRSESHESFERLMQAEKGKNAPNTVIRSHDGVVIPYRQGDMVYLSGQLCEVLNIWENSVDIKDISQEPPVYSTLMKPRFETLLFADARNKYITEYLGADLRNADYTLQQLLTEDGGLFAPSDKEMISGWFRSGDNNSEIAQRLSEVYLGRASSLFLKNSEIIDYVTARDGLELSFGDREQTILNFSWTTAAEILRTMYQQERFGFTHEPSPPMPNVRAETTAYYPAEKLGLPFDIEIQTLHIDEPEREPPTPPAQNFRITDTHLGEGGAKAKFRANMDAIYTLKTIENENRHATPEEQETLSRYVGWGGLADAFDKDKREWSGEYKELEAALTPEEYAAARSSTLNAHYTSPTVIKAIYDALGNMGFKTGNILEPAMGVGNFFGMLPEEMRSSRLYGVELDSISGRIAKQLYPQANITVAGFETTDRKDFFDVAVGNVPFGNYQVNDRAYNKLGFSIHNYFFAKALDQVRPGGIVAFVTSRYTMDAKDPTVRKYLAQRADLLGAIRLPNNAFKANAGTEVVTDIIFLQKREQPILIDPEWVSVGQNQDGFTVNSYYLEHPEMILGRQSSENTQYGKQDFTVEPIEGLELADQLADAIKYIRGTYTEAELPDLGENETIRETIPADPAVKNYSYTVVDGEVYYRENSVMVRPELNATAKARVKGMVALRNCVNDLIDLQMDEWTPDSEIAEKQGELNRLYDAFTAKYGLINDRPNRLAFADDSSYYLLCSLEVLDEDRKLERKADFFSKRTIRQNRSVTHVDTSVEALTVSIGELARVDLVYMANLMGGPEKIPQIVEDLRGIIFKEPSSGPFDYAESGENWSKGWQTADKYLSGNVRKKLREARRAAEKNPDFKINVEALEKAQPKDLDASEIEVRIGSTWVDKEVFQQFMYDTFETPYYMRRSIQVEYSPVTAEWHITGKSSPNWSDVAAYTTFGTGRANAYEIMEDTLNLRDVRIYDIIKDDDGKERRVLNSKETTLAAQKQQAIKDAFQDWVWKDPRRREALVKQYNELMNSTRPREYDGSFLVFAGMNPEIRLREHQKNAIAHVIYGGNTMLAHEVGAGKTFEMVAAAMESKRLGLCSKSIFVVPNHLTEQWSAEFLRLYPSANILVTTKKDFEPRARKKFCSRIATGDYDAVIIGHSQFEKIPISKERQERLLREQIADIEAGIDELQWQRGEKFSIKQMEKTKKSLQARLEKLQAEGKKDDVITFEQLGVDRLFVDESDNYKNLFLYTKMRNVAGLSTTDAQKSSDMFAKCRYMDELTGGRGIIFATGTPISNSMTEMYTVQRYLQYDRLQELGMSHFDCWASRFGETTTALELAPEGTGYRARTRFAKFFNLPELMTMFKEVADIKTADQLDLPTPKVEYHNFVSKPTEIQQEMVKNLSERATEVHKGAVDPTVDNMLKITSDGRKLGLDQRIINPMLPDNTDTKVNQCVQNILQFCRDGEDKKLTQLVFCDLSTPKTKKTKPPRSSLDSPEIHALEDMIPLDTPAPDFTIYEDIRQKLIAGGMPPEQVAFIHEADTEVKKKELFAKVRSGQVRVLLGSTAKMGAGTNVQDRLIALHDLDAPWRPRDLTQRKGRIERQGNQNETVHVCRYVTEGTFDAYLWQTLETKQRFISQIMTSKSPVRSCEDIDETALSFAEVKAICAGDPRIKERMDLDVDVSRLKLLKADHQSKQYRLEDQILKYYPQKIEEHKGYIRGFETDLKTLAEHPLPQEGFVGMEIRGDVLTDKENAGAALIDAVTDVKSTDPVEIGHYRGFPMTAELTAFGQYTLRLCGEMTHSIDLGMDPRGNLVRIENVLEKIPERMRATQAQLDNYIQQQEAAKAELGKPFPQEQELKDKTARLIELDMELNLDGRGDTEPVQESTEVAKSARPSVLDRMNALKENSTQTEKKPHREPER